MKNAFESIGVLRFSCLGFILCDAVCQKSAVSGGRTGRNEKSRNISEEARCVA